MANVSREEFDTLINRINEELDSLNRSLQLIMEVFNEHTHGIPVFMPVATRTPSTLFELKVPEEPSTNE